VSERALTLISLEYGTNSGSATATPPATQASARGRGTPNSTQYASAAKKSGAR
jgi:hypothetical protein